MPIIDVRGILSQTSSTVNYFDKNIPCGIGYCKLRTLDVLIPLQPTVVIRDRKNRLQEIGLISCLSVKHFTV